MIAAGTRVQTPAGEGCVFGFSQMAGGQYMVRHGGGRVTYWHESELARHVAQDAPETPGGPDPSPGYPCGETASEGPSRGSKRCDKQCQRSEYRSKPGM